MLNELAKEAVKIHTEKGFYGNREVGMLLALIHSEVSEALEEYRNGHEVNETYYQWDHLPGVVRKPEGVPTELADIIIRVLDMCGTYEIDIDYAIREKMEYNRTREWRHGGKRV